jgi:hypothetical protein
MTISEEDFLELKEVVALHRQTSSATPFFMANYFLHRSIPKNNAERLRYPTGPGILGMQVGDYPNIAPHN